MLGKEHLYMKLTICSQHTPEVQKRKKKLEQIFCRKLLAKFAIVFILLFFVILIYNFNEERVDELQTQTMILEDLNQQYDAAQLGLEHNLELFQQDYLNRSWSVEFILKGRKIESITTEELSQIAQLMQVNAIHLISDDAKILISSSKDALGINLKENKNSSAFWCLIDGTSDDDHIIQIEMDHIPMSEQRIYVGVKSELPGISMIQLDIPTSVYHQAIDPFTIKSLVERIPTEKATAIFVVDADTGELVAITKNNDQEVVFEEGETSSQFLEHLKNHNNRYSVRINGTLKHLTVMESGDYIYGSWTDISSTYANSIYKILMTGLLVLILLSLMYWILETLLKRYILKDIEKVNQIAERLLAGEMEVAFPELESQELMNLSQVLNRWRENYVHKSERMTKMIEKIDSNVAMFECFRTIDRVFFSSNMITLLDMDKKQLNQTIRHVKNFEEFISSLKANEDEHKYIKIGNHYVSLNVMGDDQEFYGVIIDRTLDMAQILNTEKKLEEARDIIKRDQLTGLYNRKGMEDEISVALENNPQNGIMMIFDLDNFKKINDNAGHPEGDRALKVFADCLRRNFQTEDIIARMGGDEFAVFLRESLRDDIIRSKCNTILEQVRISMKNYYIQYNVSTSIGIAFVSAETKTYDELYVKADAALYTAKESGKNTYFIHTN